MSEQYSIFSAPEAPAADPLRPPRGTRFYKITLTNGKSFFIKAACSMLELSNEFRNKAKVVLHSAEDQQIVCESDKVRYIERVYSYTLEHVART